MKTKTSLPTTAIFSIDRTIENSFNTGVAVEADLIVVGGGAAGFFAAIQAAEILGPGKQVLILEKSPHFLTKVRISGGGRCNVTHACFEEGSFASNYPRGQRELIGPLHRFQARDVVRWFKEHGVELKTEPDGRMFPTTDNSLTIVNCLLNAAAAAGIILRKNSAVVALKKDETGPFELTLEDGSTLVTRSVLLATGGCRSISMGKLATAMGHTLIEPVPSLFTFTLQADWPQELAGITLESAELTVPSAALRQRGPLLITHVGLSGPVVLRLSAWGARRLAQLNYQFDLQINWLPSLSSEKLEEAFLSARNKSGSKRVGNFSPVPLPERLWRKLIAWAGITPEQTWAALRREEKQALKDLLHRTVARVVGKSLNKDEFVTCGGVSLKEVNFQTMQSRICPGLFFAGELLDIDGITGGFNFQAAWTTGWIAGRAAAAFLGDAQANA